MSGLATGYVIKNRKCRIAKSRSARDLKSCTFVELLTCFSFSLQFSITDFFQSP